MFLLHNTSNNHLFLFLGVILQKVVKHKLKKNKARHKRPHIIRCHLYEVFRIGKSTDRKISGCLGLGVMEKVGGDCYMAWSFLRSDENFQELESGDDCTTLGIYLKPLNFTC